MTIMTVPIVAKTAPSQRRAHMDENGVVKHLLPEKYHGNPIDDKGSLVTIDWGYDIVCYLQSHSGLSFLMLSLDNIDIGVRADLCEVLVGFKRPVPLL